ncbi:unnamed protein product [Vitrella brassicaformis CCMP3155]|uniref:Uncharacterized protein n=1 Tax=Vitrella brassicaformis (strain CCMP3155) TaxID=1169540 RepID=A0A0G4GQY0_VITBC|nr:unnamed protein product [Vitrella brassicaformis CCMP3155]|eukprot:CEM32855.1 unnamed protein product [Vitrella brassicaformis CCMP3155]
MAADPPAPAAQPPAEQAAQPQGTTTRAGRHVHFPEDRYKDYHVGSLQTATLDPEMVTRVTLEDFIRWRIPSLPGTETVKCVWTTEEYQTLMQKYMNGLVDEVHMSSERNDHEDELTAVSAAHAYGDVPKILKDAMKSPFWPWWKRAMERELASHGGNVHIRNPGGR